jgi:hypothetical protein
MTIYSGWIAMQRLANAPAIKRENAMFVGSMRRRYAVVWKINIYEGRKSREK